MQFGIFCLDAGHFEIGIEPLKPPRQGCVDGQKLHIAQHQDDEPRWLRWCFKPVVVPDLGTWWMKKCKLGWLDSC